MADTNGKIHPNSVHSSGDTFTYWLKEARKHQRAGNYLEALRAYYRIIYSNPQDAQIYKDMGYVLYELNQYEQALFRFEQALYFDPADPTICQKKATLLDLLGRIDAPEEEQTGRRAPSGASGWARIPAPKAWEICERIKSISLPVENQLLLVDTDDYIHRIDLATPEAIQADEMAVEDGDYDWEKHILTYAGKQFPMLGVDGGFPLLTSLHEERLAVFTRYKNIVSQPLKIIRTFRVQAKNGESVFEFQFDDFSGDWFWVSFSFDARYIIAAAPYDFYLFERSISPS